MDQTPHTTQIYSPFGAGYVPEAHSANPANDNKAVWRKRGPLLIGALLAASTAAGAITLTSWTRSSFDEIWTQQSLPSVMKLPGAFGIDEAIY
jgi:hypothetical protein